MNDLFQNEPNVMQQMAAQSGGANYFTVSGYITYVKNDEKAYYLACPDDNCRRKVQENDGTFESQMKYRCDNCNKCY